jgi:hypothetical protein
MPPLRTRALAVPFALFLASRAGATPAPAAERAPSPATRSSGPASTAAPPPRTPRVEELPVRWKVWRLFDPKLAPRELGWSIGPGYLRTLGREQLQYGIVIGRKETMEERRGPLFLSLEREWALRLYERWTIIPVYRYGLLGGLRVGPIEVAAGVSAIPFALDYAEGRFSFSGPSPGAALRVGFKTGKLRVSVRAEREYLWRWGGQPSPRNPPTGKSLLDALRVWHWTGQPDAMMTGLMLEIAGEQTPDYRSGGHPLIFVK